MKEQTWEKHEYTFLEKGVRSYALTLIIAIAPLIMIVLWLSSASKRLGSARPHRAALIALSHVVESLQPRS